MIIAHPHPGPLPEGEGVIEGVLVSESLVLYEHCTPSPGPACQNIFRISLASGQAALSHRERVSLKGFRFQNPYELCAAMAMTEVQEVRVKI